MTLVLVLVIAIVGFEVMRRSKTFVGRLRIALVTLLVISLTVAGAP